MDAPPSLNRTPIPVDKDRLHISIDDRHLHHHENRFHRDCHTCVGEFKVKKSPSASSDVTVTVDDDRWTPPSVPCHPLRMTDRERELCKPVWVPDPESPAERYTRPRTLVLLFDGTGDQFDNTNSNVVQFLASLKKNDKERQLVYYQTGIGTVTTTNFVTPIMRQISKTFNSMFAWNMRSHIQAGYMFLVQNYKAGDRISIFGFSRGAYTARAVAGMVQRVGLLPTDNVQQIPFAWNMYIRDDEDAEKDSAEYKRTFSSDVTIDFVGVWDTVASVGFTYKNLPFVKTDTAFRVFRHALSLDERRAKFKPNYYHTNAPYDMDGGSACNRDTNSAMRCAIHETMHSEKLQEQERNIYPKKDRNTPTDACEVWFAGCHCDVGGGSVKNDTPHSLARIPLRWMIRECFRMKTGIIFDARILHEKLGLDYRTLYPIVEPRPDRITWTSQTDPAVIQEMQPQGLAIFTIARFLVSLGLIPFWISLTVALWPFTHIWLFLKYSAPVKAVRKRVKHAYQDSALDVTVSICVELGTWIYKKAFPKENHIPMPCSKGCRTEEEHEYWDAHSPIYDQLEIRWLWKVLEYLPIRFVKQTRSRDDCYIAFNCGSGRKIYGDALHKKIAPGSNIFKGLTTITERPGSARAQYLRHTAGTYHRTGSVKIHRSVLTRIEAQSGGKPAYRPRAFWECREDGRDGTKGPKVKGPERWDIQDPDPATQWEWVD